VFESSAGPFVKHVASGHVFYLSTLVLRRQHNRRNLDNKSAGGGGGGKIDHGYRESVRKRGRLVSTSP